MKKNLTKIEWMKKNGFDTNGLTWCIFGDNTFIIKDQLKEMGCKFSPILKWHSPIKLDLPIEYKMIPISFNDIMEWDEKQNNAFFFENAKEKIEQKFREIKGPNLSEFIGEIGERLYNKIVILKTIYSFNSKFGLTNIYTFVNGNNQLVWFTTKKLKIKKGDILDLTGTVMAHKEFKGIKTTQLNRCILKKIGD